MKTNGRAPNAASTPGLRTIARRRGNGVAVTLQLAIMAAIEDKTNLAQRFMIDWNIQSRAQACQACGKPFLDKQPFHTLLFDQTTGYERLDVCEPCWAAQYRQSATSRKGFISHLQGVFELPAEQPEPIRKENCES